FPKLSVSVQRRTMIWCTGLAGQPAAPVESVKVIIGDGSQVSVTSGIPVTDGSVELPQSTVASGGHVIVGVLTDASMLTVTDAKSEAAELPPHVPSIRT